MSGCTSQSWPQKYLSAYIPSVVWPHHSHIKKWCVYLCTPFDLGGPYDYLDQSNMSTLGQLCMHPCTDLAVSCFPPARSQLPCKKGYYSETTTGWEGQATWRGPEKWDATQRERGQEIMSKEAILHDQFSLSLQMTPALTTICSQMHEKFMLITAQLNPVHLQNHKR